MKTRKSWFCCFTLSSFNVSFFLSVSSLLILFGISWQKENWNEADIWWDHGLFID